MKYIIYLIHDNTNNFYYIGKTSNWYRRAIEHHLNVPAYKKTATRYYKKPKPDFSGSKSIMMAAEEGHELEFTWLGIYNTKSEVNRAEVYWIQTFKNLGYYLYNKTCGGTYDNDLSVKEVDISRYPKLTPLPVDKVAKILQNPQLLRQDMNYYGLEKTIRDTILQCQKYW